MLRKNKCALFTRSLQFNCMIFLKRVEMPNIIHNLKLLFQENRAEEFKKINTLHEKFVSNQQKDVTGDDKKWMDEISRASEFSTQLSYLKMRSKIKEMNNALKTKNMHITLPISVGGFICLKISLPIRLILASLTDVVHLAISLFSVMTKKWTYKDRAIPEQLKDATPILLIHGSRGNRTAFCFFRRLLETKNTGNVFTLNLNAQPAKNDRKTVEAFALAVQAEMEKISGYYELQGKAVPKIHLVGYSMGGLVAAQAALKNERQVASVTTLSTPWGGTAAADLVGYTKEDKPEGIFVLGNPQIKSLREQFLASTVPKTTFAGGVDMIVRPESSMLPLEDKNRVFSYWNSHHSMVYSVSVINNVRKKILMMEKEAKNNVKAK
jgi:hypothetical protein